MNREEQVACNCEKTESFAKESFFTDVYKNNDEIVAKANKLISEVKDNG